MVQCVSYTEALPGITQLYVSVDAATPETLKAIDRPLFGDFWVRPRGVGFRA
jgi:wyosine [tRNA(Phe)-imidazoG37] synthetase (radical SAM superfamily)